jgi:hypothetical protein
MYGSLHFQHGSDAESLPVYIMLKSCLKMQSDQGFSYDSCRKFTVAIQSLIYS